MDPLVTSDELASFLQQDLELDETTNGAASLAVREASGVVRRYCRRAFGTGTVPDEVRLIVLRVASRIYKNPQGQSSYSYDGVYAQQPVDVSGRILTTDERLVLDHFRKRTGSVAIVTAPITRTPDPDAYPPGF